MLLKLPGKNQAPLQDFYGGNKESIKPANVAYAPADTQQTSIQDT
jgi:hypothetical protein